GASLAPPRRLSRPRSALANRDQPGASAVRSSASSGAPSRVAARPWPGISPRKLPAAEESRLPGPPVAISSQRAARSEPGAAPRHRVVQRLARASSGDCALAVETKAAGNRQAISSARMIPPPFLPGPSLAGRSLSASRGAGRLRVSPLLSGGLMRFALLAAALSLPLAAQADEGMWVPQQLPEIAGPLREAGLALPPEQLADLTGDPMWAAVALGVCTASVVSPEGLVATTHHCAYGAIQLNSSPERNLLEDGFIAAERGQELSAGPSARIYVMDGIREVTAEIQAAAGDLAGAPRQQAIEAAQKRLVAECEAEPGYRCTVYSFFGGQTYRLFRQLEIRDVRLVYAPPRSIGNYGGEIDNWMWPRHTGDFSFYRAYVGPDGKPAPYSADNVPYRPKQHLRLASEPLKAGDFVMVAGYPGRTNRYALYDEFQDVATSQYPVVGQYVREREAIIDAAGEQDEAVKIKYASTIRRYQNAMKNWAGQLEGFARTHAAQSKRAEEQAVLEWLRRQGRQGRAGLAAH